MKIGTIHGRFQVFHNGHLEYALQAKSKCDFLIVGITNPDITLTKEDETHVARSRSENNPFTYYERMLMIREALLGVGLAREVFEIVPFPINYPELLSNYIPLDAVNYTRVYEDWNRKKIKLLKEQGLVVEVMHEDTPENKTHTAQLPIGGIGEEQLLPVEEGTKVRKRMLEDRNWRDYVPPGTAKIVDELGLIDRLA